MSVTLAPDMEGQREADLRELVATWFKPESNRFVRPCLTKGESVVEETSWS